MISLTPLRLLPIVPILLLPTVSLEAAIVTSGLIQDLDADSGVVEGGGVGTGVTAWQNQAASGGDDVATNDGVPTVVTGPNGGNAVHVGSGIRLAGSDDTAFDDLMNGNGFTWFVVIRSDGQNSSAKNAVFGTLRNANPWTGFAAHVGSDNLGRSLLRPTGSDNFTVGSGDLSSGWHILAGRLEAGTGSRTVEIFTDGPTADASGSVNITGSTNTGALAVGAEHVAGSENFDGDVARILIYDRPLTDPEFNETGAALATLYDIDEHGFVTGPLPEIPSFTATPNPVVVGGAVTLAWTVNDPEGGTPQLAITPGVGDVTGQSSVQVNPTVTTTYTLVAQNINGSEAKEITVTVGEAPTISSFSVSDSDIRIGESSTLSWNVSGAATVNIDQGIGSVAAADSMAVSPAVSTTYTLTATNAFGSSNAQVTITVDPAPVINSFTVDQLNIDPGTAVTLSWNVSGATSLAIDQGVGDVTGQTSVQDTPASTRTYTLTASNAQASAQASVSVIVGETLTISEFLAANNGGLADEDGEDSDWIEIHNTTGSPISLNGWYLTDDASDLTKWQFPNVTLNGGAYLVVFASSKNRAVAGSELHTNFKLSSGGEFLALVKPDGVTITRQYAPEYPEQVANISYGIFGAQLTEGFFDPPTPGAANGTGFAGFVGDTTFTLDRGFYNAPIQVGISTNTAGAQIRYTLDGSEPSDTAGTLYSGPVSISSTTVLRAIAYQSGLRSSNIDTQTYLYTADIKNQSDMDTDVVGVSPYNASIEDDLKAIPTMSLVLPNSSMFGGSGIYSNSGGRGMAWERAVSVEFFTADGSEEFQYDAGIRIHGADARNHQKKPFKLYFRDIYGPGKLRYPLFPGEVQEYDKLVLRGGGHEAWTSPWSVQANSATYLRDQFLRQTHGEIGNLSPRGRFVHLYINGAYWGLYNVHERPDDEFGEAHLGGEELDYDVIKTGGAVVDGNKTDWNAVQALANAGLSNNTDYQQILGELDINSLIDNMIVRIWSGDIDWLRSQNTLGETGNRNKNWYALRKTRNGALGWQFYVWDGELSMGKGHTSNRNTNFDLTDVDIADSPGRLYTRLRDNAEFRLLFADRLHKHFFNDGVMTPAANQARWSALAVQIQNAVVAESARWGDATRGTPYTRDGEWQSEVDWMHDTFMVGRTATVLSQFEAIGLYPAVDAPEFTVGGSPQHGGEIGASQIGFGTIPAGAIYYTTDGSDPRVAFTGAVSGTAQQYVGTFSIPASRTVKARVLDGGTWSALTEAVFIPGTAADATNLVISEIHYNPLPPSGAGELAVATQRGDFEYVELMNISGGTIDLGLVSFTAGVTFTFPVGTTLGSGVRMVLASNTAAFTERYGFAPDGEFGGNLNDGGELLTLLDNDGVTPIRSFSYGDDFPWPEGADGTGYSLVLIAPESNPLHGVAQNWRSSVSIGGTPGGTDAVAFVGDPNGDANGNGLSNLLEHALGGTLLPSVSVQSLEVSGVMGDHLTFTLRKSLSADDVVYTVQTSKDLVTWQALDVSRLSSSTNNGDGTATEVWRVVDWPPVDERCFVRLMVAGR